MQELNENFRNSCSCNCQENSNTVDCDIMEKMLEEIRCYEFGITELANIKK